MLISDTCPFSSLLPPSLSLPLINFLFQLHSLVSSTAPYIFILGPSFLLPLAVWYSLKSLCHTPSPTIIIFSLFYYPVLLPKKQMSILYRYLFFTSLCCTYWPLPFFLIYIEPIKKIPIFFNTFSKCATQWLFVSLFSDSSRLLTLQIWVQVFDHLGGREAQSRVP